MKRINIVSFRGREDKLELVAQMFSSYLEGYVLDVGCDQMHLATRIKGHYIGLDINGRPDVKANMEYGLPFKDKSFDAVIAFDILEHLENIHSAFDELCRVARSYIIVGLPNMYEWRYRLLFLMGKKLSGKYGLPPERPTDCHRWLFSLDDAMSFIKFRATKNRFSIVQEVLGYYSYRRLIPKFITALGKLLATKLASLFAYHYWVVLKIKNGAKYNDV